MSSSENPTNSRIVTSSKVNDKIIEYYLKYAKDRDIEKFMRFSSSCASKSTSSDENEYLMVVQRCSKSSLDDRPTECPFSLDKRNEQSQTVPTTPVKDIAEEYTAAPDSIVKNAKKLEWDSLADVGYKKANSTGNISSLERSVLKELFSECPSEPNISRQRSNEDRTSSSLSLNQKSRRERWRQTLDTLSKKYSSMSASLDTQEFIDQPQSTPKVLPNTEKSCQTTFDKRKMHKESSSHKENSSQIVLDQITAKRPQEDALLRRQDHSCQTSFDKRSTKRSQDDSSQIGLNQITAKRPQEDALLRRQDHSCQTSFDQKSTKRLPDDSGPRDHSCQTSFDQRIAKRSQNAEKFCQTSISRLKSQEAQANLSSRRESFATQSSFEYHAGESSSSKSSARRSILSEKNTNSRQSSDSDKENQLTKKSTKPKSEVDLGIKLLCSLIDAKNLSGSQKKNLAKKIFEKIMKQQPSASTSTSRSSAFSVRSLIDSLPQCEDETNRSGTVLVQQMSEHTQTESPKADDNAPTTSPSLEDPITMREWLHPLTRSEKDYDKKLKIKAAQAVSPQTNERQKQLSWIELEINRLEGLKNLLIQECPSRGPSSSSKSTILSGGKAEVIYEETSEDVVNLVDEYKRTTRRTSQNVVIYDEPTADDGKQPEKVEYKKTRIVVNEEQLPSSSSSQKNHRSKLETPISSPDAGCESVSAFANQLQKQFMDNYSKKERCVSEHYSEPRICGKPIFNRNPSYTSVASSAFCMSSEMSIPIVESSSTSTTTHQYDSHGGCNSIGGVAVQTTYSVIKTDPIFGPRCKCLCTCGKECKCGCPRPTVRVSGKAFHQTVQVKPKALAYVIRFNETSNQVTEDQMTLQQRLEMQKPDFCSKANERREILKKLHKLREEREQRIREIADSSSVSSISRKLDALPPPPIKQVRICPTREMKGLTKKRYCKLPEVVLKQEREKLERRKRTTRVITNIFNKKLQRMVHTGKMSLEYSRTVI